LLATGLILGVASTAGAQIREPVCLIPHSGTCGQSSSPPAARDSVTCPSGATFAWDWATGYLSMDGGGELVGCDTLTILGLPAGQPVALRARVHAIAHVDSGAFFGTSGYTYDLYFYGPHLDIGFDAFVNLGDPPVDLDMVKEIPLPCVAGDPFAVNLQYSGGAGHAGEVSRFRGLLEFLDLPAGATIVSRRGGTDPTSPTATRTPTWGALKMLWR
jgi:hypothetical protein